MESIRLNRWLAQCGVCSRRHADLLIEKGMVSINGKVVKELGTKVLEADEVRYRNHLLSPESHQYFLLNKPKGYITTVTDPRQRHTVMDLIPEEITHRIYPVGRLDKNTTGLLLLTNDGNLTKKLLHPSYEVSKVYSLTLDKRVLEKDVEKLTSGFFLDEVRVGFDEIIYLSKDGRLLSVRLHLGKNRIIRRAFEQLGYEVKKLDRTYFAGLTKRKLSLGKYRRLQPQEIQRLKNI